MTDWRDPARKRELLLRFYEFHLRYRAHPGGVYYLLPELVDREPERFALWTAFVNGHSQHALTTFLIVGEFPDPTDLRGLDAWWAENHRRLGWDTDRRHHKQMFVEAAFRDAERASDPDWWGDVDGDWLAAWERASSLHTMGRLSTWSYLEFLTICAPGFCVEPTDLMLRDRAGSRSHRNGLCLALGLDEFDWHSSNPDFDGRYPEGLLRRLDRAGSRLLADARARFATDPTIDDRHVSYLTLESVLCTFKSMHRPNRRYPNVYNDMVANRIREAEQRWPERDWSWAWDARATWLPDALRVECRPDDPGLAPVKQNWFRETGEVPMLGFDWPDLFPSSLPGASFGA